jgi:hypothetical protein
MSAVVSGLIGGAMAAAIGAFVARRTGKAAVPGQLRFGPFMWILAVACLVFCLLPIVGVIHDEGNDSWAKAGLIIGFGAGALYCFAEAAFVGGSFDDEGISFSTPWTGSKHGRWKDLESVTLNDTAGWYALTFKGGSTIRLSRYLNGHASALEAAQTAHPLPTEADSANP